MARRMEGLISNFTGSLQWKLYGHKAAHYQFSQILFAFSWQLILSLDFIFPQVFKYIHEKLSKHNTFANLKKDILKLSDL